MSLTPAQNLVIKNAVLADPVLSAMPASSTAATPGIVVITGSLGYDEVLLIMGW